MKRLIILLFVVFVIITGAYIIIDKEELLHMEDTGNEKNGSIAKIKSKQEKKEVLPLLDEDLFHMIGEDTDNLTKKLGDPDRKDMSAYGYTWWVYTDGVSEYAQFGVADGEVNTVFATGDYLDSGQFKVGMPYDTLNAGFELKNEVVYKDGLSFYKFLLDEEELQLKPLIKISDDVFVQCYFDSFTNGLSAIRLLTGETLLEQRIYEMEYRGSLPDKLTFSDKEWEKIEAGMEAQIFDLTNVYRNRFDAAPLKKDEQIKEVAYLHSKDMETNNYFSHYAQDGSGLKERLEKKNIYYTAAGENIAAQHSDAPAAMEGWLNSEGHREALLNEEYTHLGVGAYHLYYTQNFLSKP